MPDRNNIVTRKITVKTDDPVLIKKEKSQESTGPIEVFHSEEVLTKEIIPKGQLKKTAIVTANPDAPVDGMAQAEKTDEQIENLNKLQKAKEFLKTDESKKLAQSMLEQQGDISKGQRKWLKKQGVDPDAFVQEWNKINPYSNNNKTHNAQKAAQHKEEMGTLANTHLGDGKKRKTFKEIDENGNIVKTKVVYNKDGSVKKVITKGDSDGKLVVKKKKTEMSRLKAI